MVSSTHFQQLMENKDVKKDLIMEIGEQYLHYEEQQGLSPH